MRCLLWILIASVPVLLLTGCQGRNVEPDYQPTATVKDIMDSMVDPVADVLWNSVATVISATGTEEKAPHTDEEWAAVRRSAITLMEATNLLRMQGRKVAKHGEKSENPKIELEPEEIQALIDQDRAAWNRLARGLHDAGDEALKAIESKD